MLAYVLKMVWFVNLSGADQIDYCNAVHTNTDAKVYKVAVNSRQKFHSWEPKNPQSSFFAKLLIREESGQSLQQFYCRVNTVDQHSWSTQLINSVDKNIYFYYIRSPSRELTVSSHGPLQILSSMAQRPSSQFSCFRKFYGPCLCDKRSYLFFVVATRSG